MSWRTPEELKRVARIGGLARARKMTVDQRRAAALVMNAARWKKAEKAEEWLMGRVRPREVELGEMSARAFERMAGEECS